MGVIVTSANSPYDVSAGQIDTDDVVDSGGYMFVLSGGIADLTTVNASGVEYVNTGGTDNGATLSGGAQNVSGLASNATVDSGGEQVVETSGTAASTTVNASGYQDVYGTANNTTIGNGGEQVVFAGGRQRHDDPRRRHRICGLRRPCSKRHVFRRRCAGP
jgi:autotransporter passenger strand-loop-strand repeat protein